MEKMPDGEMVLTSFPELHNNVLTLFLLPDPTTSHFILLLPHHSHAQAL